MKVIFAIRNNYLEHFGGDVVQMQKTKEFLEKAYPVEIVICNSEESILEHDDADAMHIFNIQTIDESYRYHLVAKKMGIPVALSTIYGDFSETIYLSKLIKLGITKPTTFGKKLVVSLLGMIRKNKEDDSYLSKSYFEKTRELVEGAQVLLPNSDEEIISIAQNFQMDAASLQMKTIVVPNAVDISKKEIVPYTSKKLPENFVLEVARVESTKNQLNVIRALYDQPQIPIVFVGAQVEGKYLDKVKELAKKRGNTYFLGKVAHEELGDIYRRAAVHILPSFRETTGLSSLEALFYGCKIVVSNADYCPVSYYQFDQYGELCDPYHPKSIQKAIHHALETPFALPPHYFERYNYEVAAKQTFLGYSTMLNS